MTRLFLQTLLLTFLVGALSCQTRQRQPETWLDVAGAPQNPLHIDGAKATVLLFLSSDCPISNAYAPELGRIESEYGPRGVRFFGVHCDNITPAAARAHAGEYRLTFPVLLDPEQKLARHVGAHVTPEAAVLNERGDVVYVGRIDDLFVTFGKRRVTPTQRDLRNAIDAVLEGREVKAPAAPAVGCELPLSG